MNVIIEEIKVEETEGQIEVFRIVKSENKIKSFVDKIDYKLKKSDEDISSDFLKIFIKELDMMILDKTIFNLKNQTFLQRIFFRNSIKKLIELLKKNLDKSSWIIAPKWLQDVIQSIKFERDLKLYFFEVDHIYLGNYNSCTLLRMQEWYFIIQNDKIKKIEIN